MRRALVASAPAQDVGEASADRGGPARADARNLVEEAPIVRGNLECLEGVDVQRFVDGVRQAGPDARQRLKQDFR